MKEIRTCVVCKKKDKKCNLHRIIKCDKYILDKEQKINKRGMYICKNIECMNRLSKNKKLANEELIQFIEILKMGE
ncbi:MAG: DUF448 domain-containing protein [Clostridia bacterium]